MHEHRAAVRQAGQRVGQRIFLRLLEDDRVVDHGGGLFTQYMHLSRIDVKDGDVVTKGTVVGLAGATGRVTGPHLHWGARWNGARVNPASLLALPAWPVPGLH